MSLATSDVSTDQFVYRTLVGTITAAIFTTGYHDELKETLVIWVPGGELMQSHYFLIFFLMNKNCCLKICLLFLNTSVLILLEYFLLGEIMMCDI